MYAQLVVAQTTIEVKHENGEGVIFCRSFYSEADLKTYNVFDLSLAQVMEFENVLKETGKSYPGYVRQYNGIKKDNKNLLVASLIYEDMLDKGQNWRKEIIIFIDGCEITRSIVYDLDEQKILWDRPGNCES